MKSFRPPAALVLLFCCMPLVSCVPDSLSPVLSGMPSTVSKAVGYGEKVADTRQEFTPEQEYYLGRAVAAQILARYPAVKDAKANAYLNRLGQALALHATLPETFAGYHFLLLDTDEVNAFAAPGGLIFVTRGMLALVSGEDELAAVLAHEIAHVQNKDAVGVIQNSRLMGVISAMGKDTAGRYSGGRVPAAVLNVFSDAVGEVTTTLVTKGYSRDQEYAADAASLGILERAGYDPRTLQAVLRTMEKRVPGGSAGFAGTHPTPEQRLKALRATADAPAAEPEARTRRVKEALASSIPR